MPATLKKLIENATVKCDIEMDGDPKAITVHYSMRKMTGRMLEDLAKMMAESPDEIRPVVRQFMGTVVSWNFARDEGEEPIPIEEEALMDVGLEILGTVLEQVTIDAGPKGATDTSSNGSSPAPPNTKTPSKKGSGSATLAA